MLDRRLDLPYGPARVEEHGSGSRRRFDFVLYRRGANRIALTGEVKMPDTPQGKSPFHEALVEDAFTKAAQAGTPYYFTWNVRDLVLFETHREGVPFMDRQVEGPVQVAEVTSSDDAQRGDVQDAIREFWEGFLVDFAALESGRRRIRNIPLDQRFVRRLEAALEEPITATQAELARRYRADQQFRDELTAWMVTEQGWEDSTSPEQLRQNLERAARLSCYVLTTRLVFYEVLRRKFPNITPLVGMQPHTPEELSRTIESRFVEAVTYSGDYETVFTPNDFGSTLPFLAANAHLLWRSVVERIDEFDFSRLDFDIIGQLYERLIGPAERRRYGQYYTSPDVVDLINAFCIRSPDAKVLDPGCGGGTFLVRAYARKRALAQRENQARPHQDLLREIMGTDRATFPAQLSIINLAVRNITHEANYPRVVRQDFFDARRGVPLTTLPPVNGVAEDVVLEELDAVVGNPPYIRQEELPREYKERLAAQFRSEWPGQRTPSGRSDIYVYFFTHAAAFLPPGSHLGFVTSVGWLDTDYGFRLQEFFLRNFRILAVIESQVEKWFEDARVTTAVTILQREPDEAARMSNIVRFIQLRKPLAEIYSEALKGPINESNEVARQADLDAVRELIEEIQNHQNTDYWRVHVVSQRELWEQGCRLASATIEEMGPEEEDAETDEAAVERQPSLQDGAEESHHSSAPYLGGKWGQYLRAPDVWFDILEYASPLLVPLHELADIRRGFTSGVDKFYCVRDVTDEQLDRLQDPAAFHNTWGISRSDTRRIRIIRDGEGGLHLVESRFLEPEFHTLMEARSAIIRTRDVKRMVLNAPVSRAALRNTHLGRYVAFAEQQGWNTGATVASRAHTRPWYDLGLRPKEERAHFFWPKAQQYRHLVPWNEDKLPCKDRLYEVWARDSVDARLLWAVLNSSFTVLAKHVFGRLAGIEGNLDTHVIDVNAMLVPDVRRAAPDAAGKAIAAADVMGNQLSNRYLYEEFSLADRRQLDDAVLEMLGIDDVAQREHIRQRLYQAIEEQQRATREREIVAQQHRRQSARGGTLSATDIAEEIWDEHHQSLNLQQFPDGFLRRSSGGEYFDLPPGQVEVGTAMIETGRQLRAGTIRVGGSTGNVLDIGSPAKARFIQSLAECGYYGSVRVPDDQECEAAYQEFTRYKNELAQRFTALAAQHTRDQRRQRAIVDALTRRALAWRGL